MDLRLRQQRLVTGALLLLCITLLGYAYGPSLLSSRPSFITSSAASAASMKRTDKVSTVLVVFSNHVDIGFDGVWPELGYDNNVINRYFDVYFPRAVTLGEEYKKLHGGHFVWTTQAYLLSLFLHCPPGMGLHCPSREAVANVTRSIRQGHITWHAYPHNAQLELADPSMVEFGVDLVHELDRRVGQPIKTTLSQRDVPGLTRAVLPILARAGVRAINVGVNGGSAPPGVPKNTVFIWRDPETGAQVLAAWHPGGYGGKRAQDCVHVAGMGHVLCPTWRGDNSGPPPNVSDIAATLSAIQAEFPGAKVRPSTFEEYLYHLEMALPDLELPVVTGEIGDTWIHGVQSDPRKVAQYRSVQRARRWCLKEKRCDLHDPAFRNFSRLLSKVHEHTWGVDIKQTLHDTTNWSNAQLHAALSEGRDNYQACIKSWIRQANYVQWAVEALPEDHPISAAFKADMDVLSYKASSPHTSLLSGARSHSLTQGPLTFKSQAWVIEVNPVTGALQRLQRQWPSGRLGVDWAGGASSLLGQIQYSTFDEASFDTIWDRYMYMAPPAQWWFKEDFGKTNCSLASPRRADTVPKLGAAYSTPHGNGLVVLLQYTFPSWAVQDAGAPQAMWVVLHLHEEHEGASLHGRYPDDLHLDVVWVNKTATRLPEALWVKFQPGEGAVDADSWRLNKLGRQIKPHEVITNGSMSLHAVQEEAVSVLSRDKSERLTIGSLDASLVSPGQPALFPNLASPPDMSKGVSFNLVNNIWGTNYIMWVPYIKEDASMAFRFFLRASKASMDDTQPPS